MRRSPFLATASLVIALTALSTGFQQAPAKPAPAQTAGPSLALSMPNKDGSLKFAVLGDFGTGEPAQYELAAQMVRAYQAFKYELVILVGDNLYGSERPQDFARKFEQPYKALLDAGVKFRAALGNHDSREQRSYKPFGMDGQTYYTFKAPVGSVRFFALESTYMEPKQLAWAEKELKSSDDEWKIAYFHHPLYSSANRHGSDRQLRDRLEPLFVAYNVSVVFTGHDHAYERVKPQKGITYFVAGSGGKLAPGDLNRSSPITAKGLDTEQVFLIAEIVGDQMSFNAISRTGKVIDSGTIDRRKAEK